MPGRRKSVLATLATMFTLGMFVWHLRIDSLGRLLNVTWVLASIAGAFIGVGYSVVWLDDTLTRRRPPAPPPDEED